MEFRAKQKLRKLACILRASMVINNETGVLNLLCALVAAAFAPSLTNLHEPLALMRKAHLGKRLKWHLEGPLRNVAGE